MDGYLEASSGWRAVLQRLMATLRIGRFFGVEVRLYWLALILLPLFTWIEMARWGLGGSELLFRVVVVTLALFVTVWIHEMGHILAARRYGIRTPLITISPLGGLAHLSMPVPGPRQDIFVSLAGPATHLVTLAIVWPLSLWIGGNVWRPETWWQGSPAIVLEALLQLNLALLLFNLLPIFPLDGGRVFRALLSLKLHPNRATVIACRVGQVGAVGMVIFGLFQDQGLWSSILVVIGISVFLSCLQELRAMRHSAGPYQGDVRRAWEDDPDAWKHGGGGIATAAEEAKPGWFSRRREKREEAETKREEEAVADQASEVDRILDRLNEVGLGGLTREERRILDRASRRMGKD